MPCMLFILYKIFIVASTETEYFITHLNSQHYAYILVQKIVPFEKKFPSTQAVTIKWEMIYNPY